ncbi:ribbon-helix-helix domain-containing protein [Eubacteriales bacterium OttesenSCG-928-A19]|nr:ribbon-helix-helix domain-containing protein [Eubacteriales bacterium OttesenSCG-928-A19]
MTITIRVSDEDARLIKSYAKAQNRPVSELMRNAILERIEDEIDIQSYLEVMEERKSDPETYTFDAVWKEING